MTSRSFAGKTGRQTTSGAAPKDTSAGENAVALAPPAYGIDFVDGNLTANAGTLLQGMFAQSRPHDVPVEEELLQGKFSTVQRRGPDDEELLQGRFDNRTAPVQLEDNPGTRENCTGMPDRLKSGLENLSGMDLSGVRVHYGSTKPARLNALAYTQGHEIHVASGQEKHLSHEGWHVVQQAQGRVQPTMQMAGTPVNDDSGLEAEADRMGAIAASSGGGGGTAQRVAAVCATNNAGSSAAVAQLVPTDVAITGVTHLVAPAGASIFEGTETIQVTGGDVVRIEPDESLWSRRGPNQEVEKHKRGDSTGLHMYEWYKVRSVRGEEVKGNSYLRDETFTSEVPLRGSAVEKGLMGKIEQDGKEDVFAKAHGQGSAAEITAAQKDYQSWLAASMSTGDIMDRHRSVGFEYEFATYCKVDGASPGLNAHVELGRSEELSTIFRMPFILETDENDELEAVTPPLLIADRGGEINRGAANNIYAAYKASLKALRDENMPGPEDDPTHLATLDYEASGLGGGWEFAGEMKGLCLGKRKKHATSSDHIYSQMNISLTAEEIADFTQTRSQIRSSSYQVLTEANTAIKAIFDAKLGAAFGAYGQQNLMSENEAGMAWQNLATATTNICKGLAGLVSIPSILANNEGIGQKASLFTSVKEYCGMWLKDSIPNIVDSSLADANSRIIMQALMTAAEDEVKAALGAVVDEQLKGIKDGVKEWLTWPFSKDSRADTKLAGYKTTFNNELATTFTAVIARLNRSAPRQIRTQGAPGYGGEQFGEEGLGVRKDTFVNIKSGKGRTMHLAEMRNDYVIGKLLEGRRKRGSGSDAM